MRLIINESEVLLPSSLCEITLKQRIDFQAEHGDLLMEMYKSIESIVDEDEQEIELMMFQLEKAFRTVSFFTGYSVESLKQSEFVDKIIALYTSSIGQVFEDELKLEYNQETEFVWNGEMWNLHPPVLKNGDRLTFGEFIDSKQMVQDMIGLGKNRWECLLPLCAIFLRKNEEPYSESFLYENSERLKMMENLPLDIALQVGFFLSSSLTIFKSHFQSFSPQELKELV